MKKIKIALFVALALSLGARIWAQDQENSSWDARVVALSGSVNFYPANSPTESLVAVSGLPLEAGDRIVTNGNGIAQIAFSGSGLIGLAPNSSFLVSSVEKSNTLFSLDFGNMIAKFDALLSGQSLQVQTPTAVAAVRGTEFGVGFSKTDGAQIGVFDEGKVKVTNGSGSEFLTPHQEVSVRSKSGHLQRPHPLRHFLRYRRQMKMFRRRIVMLHKNWHKRDPYREQGPNRGEARRNFLRKMRKFNNRENPQRQLRRRRFNNPQ